MASHQLLDKYPQLPDFLIGPIETLKWCIGPPFQGTLCIKVSYVPPEATPLIRQIFQFSKDGPIRRGHLYSCPLLKDHLWEMENNGYIEYNYTGAVLWNRVQKSGHKYYR